MHVPRYPTFETRMSSGPRRSPAPAIPAGRGDGRAVTDPCPRMRAGRAGPQLLRSPGQEKDMHMHPYEMEELACQRLAGRLTPRGLQPTVNN
jgi:hypothetical protein